MIYQISGCIHATKLILVLFGTFSRTRNSQIIDIIVAFFRVDLQIQCHTKSYFTLAGVGPIACPRAVSGNFWTKMHTKCFVASKRTSSSSSFVCLLNPNARHFIPHPYTVITLLSFHHCSFTTVSIPIYSEPRIHPPVE